MDSLDLWPRESSFKNTECHGSFLSGENGISTVGHSISEEQISYISNEKWDWPRNTICFNLLINTHSRQDGPFSFIRHSEILQTAAVGWFLPCREMLLEFCADFAKCVSKPFRQKEDLNLNMVENCIGCGDQSACVRFQKLYAKLQRLCRQADRVSFNTSLKAFSRCADPKAADQLSTPECLESDTTRKIALQCHSKQVKKLR